MLITFFKELMKLFRAGLVNDPSLRGCWMVDHKYFAIPQGTAMGIHLREVFILMLDFNYFRLEAF